MMSENNNNCDISCWYVIHTHPKQEDRADMNLKAWGLTTFNPKIRERSYNPYSDKVTYVAKSLFLRYIFARFNITRLHQVQFTRGVDRVVCFGDAPTPVSSEVIAEIKSRVGADGYISIMEELAPGDEVIIKDGPMKDFRGLFIGKVSAEDRVRILLETVSYQAHLEIERAWVKKAAL